MLEHLSFMNIKMSKSRRIGLARLQPVRSSLVVAFWLLLAVSRLAGAHWASGSDLRIVSITVSSHRVPLDPAFAA